MKEGGTVEEDDKEARVVEAAGAQTVGDEGGE